MSEPITEPETSGSVTDEYTVTEVSMNTETNATPIQEVEVTETVENIATQPIRVTPEPVVKQADEQPPFVPVENNEDIEDTISDRLEDKSVIDSYKPKFDTEEEPVKKSDPIEREYKFSDTQDDHIGDTGELADTDVMHAFGLDTRKAPERGEAKRIFDEYSFANTDEMEATATDADTTTEMPPVTDDEEEIIADDGDIFDYTDPSQKKDIFDSFRSRYVSTKIRLIMAALFAVVLFVIECLPRFVEGFALFGDEMMTCVVELCLVIACAALAIGRISRSVSLLFRGKMCADTVTFVSTLASFALTLTALVRMYVYDAEPVALYNFSYGVCVFFSVLFEMYGLRRDIYAFKIVSSSEPKSVIAKMTRVERFAEEKELSEYLGDYSDIYRVQKADFVSDFFKKRAEIPSCNGAVGFLALVSIIISAAAYVVTRFVIDGGADVSTGLSNAFMAYWFCAPFAALISFTYPMYIASIRAYTNNSAIVGDITPEKYDNASAIAFEDNDAFPPDRIKIKSVKVFENYRIENVIYYASSVYSLVGGPLATVFKQATLESENSTNVVVRDISDLGIDAFVDEKHIVIGQPSYMESQLFEIMPEVGDEQYEGQTNRRLLYLACGDTVVAKFYIQYNVSSDFLYIARHLFHDGICVSVRSSDPCIDNNILYKNKLDPTQYPIRVIKEHGEEVRKEKISAFQGGIVSVGSKKGIIKTLLLCDRISNVKRINLVIKVMALIFGVAITAGLMIFGMTDKCMPLYTVAYQLFWMLPIFFVSKIYL
ncbi:MAG: hypothetical protein MJ101_05560 [Clostridia bacterium]|nr:hypothetical protein [Clostridia bacterium]